MSFSTPHKLPHPSDAVSEAVGRSVVPRGKLGSGLSAEHIFQFSNPGLK